MHYNNVPFEIDGSCNPKACVVGKTYRFTLLTDRIVRMEYDPEGFFEDRPSTKVINRNLPAPEYSVLDDGAILQISTKHFHLTYQYGQGKSFNENNLVIDAKNNFTHYGARWHFGAKMYGDPPRHHNLYGTARTLDRADGAVALEFGLMSTAGHSFFDDSDTAVFGEDGLFHERRANTIDVYYICGQRDYRETLKDFYAITGKPPMLPRYALGNWWSRWYPYTADGYLELFDRFEKEDLPFSMAVLDMDWHITEVDPKYGKGWTGFTWNKEYFANPAAFGKKIHAKGVHVSLNLHPADGVQGFEDAYEAMAKATGADASVEEPVRFDMTDPVFTKAYFEHLMHPLEDECVDHWWIDWQQGRSCSVKSLDPLWLLNHNHYVDNCRDGKRGLILSRYCGLGAHRYPAGFSGDTVISWESLDFQAYFTIAATNAGFPFWSHDIGGFSKGIRDPELFVRWLQLGVFSSFQRLHSTRNSFASKEPWNFAPEYQPVIGEWLRLRHQLIPYIYSETYRQHTEALPLIQPMYYAYPMADRAYSEKNQYLFGSQLMVCPITQPADEKTGMGSVKAWIPEGVWTDFFTGKTYQGHRVAVLNRPLGSYPVLAKAGAIVPTAVHKVGSNDTSNPEELEVFVFPGADGRYDLFEDDGLTDGYKTGEACVTTFEYNCEDQLFTIKTTGDRTCIPAKRKYTIVFRGFDSFQTQNAKDVCYDQETRSLRVCLDCNDTSEEITLKISGAAMEKNTDSHKRVLEFLRFAKINIDLKRKIDGMLCSGQSVPSILEELHAEQTDRRLMEVLTELLT